MSPKPVIFLAFANDKVDNAKYLRNISAEYNAIRNILNLAQDKGLCELEMLPYATFQDIKNVFTTEKYRNRIAVFHFSGHADGFQLLLENAEGQNELAHGKGLVDYFSILKTQDVQKNLQLLFFNGCCTAQLGESLQSVIPAVIGTLNSVNDAQAKAIAVSFYDNLAKQISIKAAFDLAKAERHVDNDNLRGRYHKDLDHEPTAEPWKLYYTDEKYLEWKLEAVLPENYVFNEYLVKTLIPAMKDYSKNAENLLQSVNKQQILSWEKNDKVVEYANNIIPLFVGVIGLQLRELIVIGKEDISEAKNQKYFKKCVQIAKITLDLLCFILLSKIWDSAKTGKISKNKETLQGFFESSFDFGIQKKIDFLVQIHQVFIQNNLPLPFEEFKVLATCLNPSHSFFQSCQMLNALQNDFKNKPHLLSLLQVKKAEQALTDILASLAFLVNFKMSSIKQIGYKHSRNSEPYFIHYYSPIDNKKKDDTENLKLDKNGTLTHTVMFHKGADYMESINLFPFVIDYNALTFEKLDKIYFFNAIALDNTLEYICVEDNSEIKIEFNNIQGKEEKFTEIIKDIEKHKKLNLDGVFLQFYQAKEAIWGASKPKDSDFQMIDE